MKWMTKKVVNVKKVNVNKTIVYVSLMEKDVLIYVIVKNVKIRNNNKMIK